ncbi:MAG: hypothetical protein WD749_04675 [Phycisphaerales bacterium]
MKPQYYFGRTVAREIDYFAYPRTGSHLLRYCTQGLFDLVAVAGPALGSAEAVDRQREVNPGALYALDLREDGVPYAPVLFHTRITGQHGRPVKRENPTVILQRDAMPTIYSYYRVQRDRWGWGARAPEPRAWAREKLDEHRGFYDAAAALKREHPGTTLIIRYEDLTAGPAPLRALVQLVGVRPKLSPEFVHGITRFDSFVAGDPAARTFYREGDNDAWKRDAQWRDLIGDLAPAAATTTGAPA